MVDEMFDGSGQLEAMMEAEDSAAASSSASGLGGPMGGANAASSNPLAASATLMQDLTASDRTVHAEFYNAFDGKVLFDDKDLH